MNVKRYGFVPCFLLLILSGITGFAKNKSQYFQISVYHFTSQSQENLLDDYLANAWLPLAHKMGINNIGIFKPLANDTATDKTVYIIRSFKDVQQLAEIDEKMSVMANYNGSEAYINSNYKTPPFTRIVNTVASAFEMAPMLTLPKLTSPKSDHIYEFRSYESATEKIHNNKVQMFNQGGEVTLFSRLNFNPVFYGKVIAGDKMPNLVYMTSFENMADRDAHWKTFGADAFWKKISSAPEYQNNVSKADIVLMKATAYSDF